jgi:hypothetical protein
VRIVERVTSTGVQVAGIDVALRVARTGDGRLEGTLHRSGQAEEIAFSGTLDLLKALEIALGEVNEDPR